ncbi:DUF2779 domain-containing protein [Sulfurovum sp. TSL1]|uniref:DUF2779 domain-containing protein n=1 Tax=Sulfurovum sp. TSL1 TaxID=2826994 RepID=UPI001CC7D9F8|nr:DUF2779 domain-containing protein [Sulfurovum sp. TSL1]GIT98799.1 hypothetical protein TSL1_16200 [Sulfurovum sp. TSL1]
MTLSKSLYTRAVQCPKSLWLKKYKPEVLTLPDTSVQAILETGSEVGEVAHGLFPNGCKVQYDTNFEAMAALTRQWIEEGVETIFEATFIADGLLVMVDILCVTEDGLELYEVKSSTEMKDIYYHDVAFQVYVLQKLGYTVNHTYLMHINSDYVRGDELDLDGLFTIEALNDTVYQMQGSVDENIEEIFAYLLDQYNEPDIDIGKQCKNPYVCDAMEYCWKVQRGIPDYSIFNIFNLGSKKQVELYEQGIVDINDMPDDFDMTAKQAQAVRDYKSGEMHIDQEAIAAFLSRLSYPIYHLDFETFQQAIPQWRGISPFMQIPFQYSLHIEHENGRLEHCEFLAGDGSDPRMLLALKLCEDIPVDATVLAYNMSFEKGVIRKLAQEYETLSPHLLVVHENIIDLMIPFQQKYYVTPSMKGSYSIKYVLPALVPEMEQAYKALDGVKNGGEAMQAFANLSKLDAAEKEKKRQALLAYCKLDTLAMVKILEKLKEVNKKEQR